MEGRGASNASTAFFKLPPAMAAVSPITNEGIENRGLVL